MPDAENELNEFDAIDLCAGPGGWDVAAERLGLKVLGFEIDEAAIRTREAVGHHTALAVCAVSKSHPRGTRGLSMTEVDPRDYFTKAGSRTYSHGRGRGGIGSPPCQGFSTAGKGQARADSERLLKELGEVRTLGDLEFLIEGCQSWMTHVGTALVLEPLRWALSVSPSWLAWEQVSQVLPIWEACAVILRRLGYSVVTGNVQAEQYGVPQTRKRAVLLARAPWLVNQLGPVALPTPTHSRYHSHNPEKIDEGMPRWVSMAEALGSADFEVVSNYGTGGDPANRGRRTCDQPSAVVTSKADRNRVEPYRPENAIDGEGPEATEWVTDCPAPTMVANFSADVVAKRGYRKPGDPPRQKTPGSVRVTAEQAAVLQSFPADYAFQGTKGKVFQQIGNAIPPRLAEALLCAVLDLPFEPRPAVSA